MPYINIKITREGATPAQKAELIEGATDLLVRVLGKNPATTVVVIDEVGLDDWGIGGLPVAKYRRAAAATPELHRRRARRCLLPTRSATPASASLPRTRPARPYQTVGRCAAALA